MTWIEWFCSLKGHECLCEVPYNILADPSNYYGLNKMVSNYDDAYDVLVGNILEKSRIKSIESDVIDLYCLFHQRYIFTEDGLSDMRKRYEDHSFGFCSRYLCDHVPLLPVGTSSELRENGLLLFCPCCRDVYVPSNDEMAALDGAAFGPNFPLEFLIHYPHFNQCGPLKVYKPKLYGMSISKESPAYREGRFD